MSDFMERNTMYKYAILFIVFMFILSMFYNFTRTPHTTETNQNLTTGTASTYCKIIGFNPEVIIYPWNNQTAEIAKQLKDEGLVDYINIKGTNGILILQSSKDIKTVRMRFIDTQATVLSQALCSINELIAFKLSNGSESKQAPGNIKIYLDPYSEPGDEVNIDITAVISDKGIESMQAEPFTKTESGIINATFKCSQEYKITALIDWEKRALDIMNVSKVINASQDKIKYQQNDALVFSRELNENEIKEIKDYLSSALNDTKTEVYPKGMITNMKDKQAISSMLEKYNVSVQFQPSVLIIETDGSNSDLASEFIKENGQIARIEQKCSVNPERFGITDNGKKVLIPSSIPSINGYVDLRNVPKNESGEIKVSFELIGSVADSLSLPE
jgi:hypothetical protein